MVKYAGGPWARQGRGWWPGATGSAPGLRWVLGPGSPGPQRAGLSPGQEEEEQEEEQRGSASARGGSGWLAASRPPASSSSGGRAATAREPSSAASGAPGSEGLPVARRRREARRRGGGRTSRTAWSWPLRWVLVRTSRSRPSRRGSMSVRTKGFMAASRSAAASNFIQVSPRVVLPHLRVRTGGSRCSGSRLPTGAVVRTGRGWRSGPAPNRPPSGWPEPGG